MTLLQVFSRLVVVGALLLGMLSVSALAQESDISFRLVVTAATCEYLPTSGPFANGDCVPVAGMPITATTPDGDPVASCVTDVAPNAAFPVAQCVLNVPFGSIVIVSADESAFPAGYYLDSLNPQTWEIPEERPDGIFGGPVFLALPADQPADELFDLPIAVINCTAMPDSPIFLTETAECDPAPGVWFEATATDGSWLGACVSGGDSAIAAGCVIPVPYDTTVVITEDEETVAPGFAPRDNPITIDTPSGPPQGEYTGPGFVNLPVPVAPPTTSAGGVVVEPTETVVPENARPAHIHPGTCGALKQGESIALEPLILGDGALAAVTPDATPGTMAVAAELSVSVIDVPLAELLASPHAINVHAGVAEMRAYLVCGAIGGPERADGSIAIGLREERDSGYEGIAYLAPNPEDPEQTLVWVFIAPALAEEEQTTPMMEIGTPEATPADR